MAAPTIPVKPAAEARGRRGGRSPSSAKGASAFESDNWLSSLRGRSRAGRREDEPGEIVTGGASDHAGTLPVTTPTEQKKSGPRGWIERFRPVKGPQAPGEERIASSPVVLGLVGSLVMLVAMGFWLWTIIASTMATQTFNRGVQDYDDGDYRTAMRDFSSFLESNPDDPRTGKARVLRAMANVRQYATAEGGTWSSALEAAKEMIGDVDGLEEYRDVRADLAELVIRAGEGLADRARLSADTKALAEAESAVGLHAQIAGEPAPAFLNKSRLPAKLSEARAAVRKAQVRSAALAAMDKALGENSATRVYDARDALVDTYADLAHDKDLIARMTAANELIRRAVVVDPKHRPAEQSARPDPLGPATSLVLRSSREPAVAEPAPDAIVLALADGFAYGLDGLSGAPLWHVPLGLASSFVPVLVPGEATALAFDARHGDLVKLDARTGALVWRLTLGEPITDPPLVLGNQLFQVLPSGKLLSIALESGELQATVNLGRHLARTPVHDESGQHLYILGRQDCLFVLARDPLSCVSVDYLGQLDGSIPCAPARLGRFLVIPENESLADSRWHILVLSEDGKKVRPVQKVDISGWTWSTPASAGSLIWATGDKGGYEAFAVGDYSGKSPFRSVARLTADATASGPAFALARSDRELWTASGHAGRFDLDAERGKIEPKAPLAQPGAALASIQTAGRLVVMTFQDQATSGVMLWGLDAETGSVVWKTVVGAPWPTPLESLGGSNNLTMIGGDGRNIVLSSEQIARGGFVIQDLSRPGDFTLPAGKVLRTVVDDKTVSVIVPYQRENLFWVQNAGSAAPWRKVGLPTVPAADPIAWGNAIFIPGQDSRAYLIDPLTGRPRAEPFVPKFDRDRQGSWLSPARLDHDSVVLADDVGRVLRVSLKTAPVARLVGEAERVLDQRIIADPASTGTAVILATADRQIRSLAARDLSPVGAWPLESPLAGPPVGIGETCFVMDRAGRVMAFSRDGQRMWSIQLDSAVVGAPVVVDQLIWLVTQEGKLHVRNLLDGQEREQIALGSLPTGGVLMAGKQELVRAGKGTIRPVVGVAETEPTP